MQHAQSPNTRKLFFLIYLAILFVFLPTLSQAENGWYTPAQTLWNLSHPPPPDHKLTEQEEKMPYPLIPNPQNFKDGFHPGLFGSWQQINLSPKTGAICGNGTPYKFYVLRRAANRNYVFIMQPGGACWDYGSCSGKYGDFITFNPNGIPDGYMLKDLIWAQSPFTNFLHWRDHFPAQWWNLVYLPYCTGDMFTGDSVQIYKDKTGQYPPLEWHHKGLRNVLAVIAWLRQSMQQPYQLLVTGISAGGGGTLMDYHMLRKHLAPTEGYLLDDSGPVFSAPFESAEYPSYRLQQKIRKLWGLDPIIRYYQQELPGLSFTDLGTIYGALANKYPQDRMSITVNQMDLNYSGYSYQEFLTDIINTPDLTKKKGLELKYWQHDLANLRKTLDQYPNWAYYMPYFRALDSSHGVTLLEFAGSDIKSPKPITMNQFFNTLMNKNEPLKSYMEQNKNYYLTKPTNLFYKAMNKIICEQAFPVSSTEHQFCLDYSDRKIIPKIPN